MIILDVCFRNRNAQIRESYWLCVVSFIVFAKFYSSQDYPHFWHQIQVRKLPRPSPGSIICWKPSQNSEMALYPWLWFITAKEYKLKSANEHRIQECSICRAFIFPPPVGSQTVQTSVGNDMWQYAWSIVNLGVVVGGGGVQLFRSHKL